MTREERRARGAAQANRARRLVVALARDPEHEHRLGDALHLHGRHALDLEAIVHETLRGRADEDVAGRRRVLDATRDVDRRAHDVGARTAPDAHRADHDEAGVDADAERELVVPLARDLADARGHRKGGADGARRVVLVGGGNAEHRHDAVADVLHDGAAFALDLARQRLEERVGELTHGVGLEVVGHRAEADDVCEEDGRQLPLLGPTTAADRGGRRLRAEAEAHRRLRAVHRRRRRRRRGHRRAALSLAIRERRPQRLLHRTCARPAVRLVERERAIDDLDERLRSIGRDRAERLRLRGRGGDHDLHVRLRVVHDPPGKQGEQRRADGPEVAQRVDLFGAPERLLGRHEGRRADGDSGARAEMRDLLRRAPGVVCVVELVAERDGAEARDAEVEDLRDVLPREEDVLRLDVAMHDAAGVRGREDVEQPVGDGQRVLER